MFQLTFQRATPPDRVALLAALRVALPDVATLRVSDAPTLLTSGALLPTGTLIVDKATAWTGADVLAAQAAVDAAAVTTPQLEAQHAIDGWSIEMKSFALALIDRLNIIQAALPVPIPPMTPAQALAAIRAKAGTL